MWWCGGLFLPIIEPPNKSCFVGCGNKITEQFVSGNRLKKIKICTISNEQTIENHMTDHITEKT